MIVDTDKLREAINHRDDGVNFETCSMRLLNRLEARAAREFAEIEAVEKLYTAEIQTV